MSRIQDNPVEAYHHYLRKGDYKKAARSLEWLISQYPKDIEPVLEIIDFAVNRIWEPELARKWLLRLIRMRTFWLDYALLGKIEAQLDSLNRARECLSMAKILQKKQPAIRPEDTSPRELFKEVEDIIKYREALKLRQKLEADVSGQKRAARPEKASAKKAVSLPRQAIAKKADKPSRTSAGEPSPPLTVKIEIPACRIPVKLEPPAHDILTALAGAATTSLDELRLLIDYHALTIRSGFDELLCLSAMNDVDRYWYQIETVKKVLKRFHGRVLLGDEVGLGKTIEAGMLIKEYLLRGMVRNVLILAPASLVSQWQEEMEMKFGIPFLSTDSPDFAKNPETFWKQRFLIASLGTAKSERNTPLVLKQFYDLVVVDEAHHLRNRTTKAWKLVNQLQKRFIFLLTATPIQNNLIELFNLITLLKPGQFKTEKVFRQEYVARGNLKKPVHRERLQELLREVMIRNTRSAIDLKLPKRFATTLRLEPSALEGKIYEDVGAHLKTLNLKKPTLNMLLREAGSSPFALRESLLKLRGDNDFGEIIAMIDSLEEISKGKALLELVLKSPAEKKIVFTQFLKSMDHVTALLERRGVPFATFRGDMTARAKDEAIGRFKADIPVLVSTESGGEGRNLQFCNTIINFDLPWNPMRIEQRIGRLHRIGQTRDVFIFNLSIRGTIEDYIVEILDSKINMFEMVIGEIEPILGHLEEEGDFDDLILDIWMRSADREGMKEHFGKLGDDLVAAKQNYLKTQALDREIFGEDYEI
ncbi:MAG: DEAD/DEAH box helicase [Proteobacteria bacterium]|nr:DEAD/DEAH box helicase [Pseudomonadota bacterium]